MSYMNIKKIIAGFILCSVVALANNVDNAKQANTNNTSNLKECENEQDKIQGCVVSEYYDARLVEKRYENNEKDGITREYYIIAEPRYETPYKNGKVNGEARFYLNNKQPLATITYKDDKAIKGKCGNNKILDNSTIESINNTITLLDKITEVLKEYCK